MSRSSFPIVSARTLVILAATVWYVGAVVLLVKGAFMVRTASAMHPGPWPWITASVGLLAGWLRADVIFGRACRRNVERIARLDRPRAWQFFRPWFFAALAVMIAGGAAASRFAQGHYGPTFVVGSLDLSIAVALLGGSLPFRGALSRVPAPGEAGEHS